MAVLAVVGRILLGILIFLLAVILLLLFFPVSYEVNGELNEEKKSVTVKVRWLFGFVRFLMTLPKPATPTLKVLWFSLMGKKDAKKEKKKPKQKGKKEKDKEKNDGATPEVAGETAQDDAQAEQASLDSVQATEGTEATSGANEGVLEAGEALSEDTQAEGDCASATVEGDNTGESSAEEQSSDDPKDRKKKKKDKKNKNEKPGNKKPLKEKVTELIEEFKFYKALWEDGNTKPFVQAALAKVLHLLKNLLPRKIRGKILFGAASPDITGYAYGGYSVLKSLYLKRFKAFAFTPDFERQILEGELFIKGWFMLFTVIWDALRILLDKRFKILRKKWKAHKNEKNKSEEGA